MMAVFRLLCVSEYSLPRKRDVKEMESSETRFLRLVKGCAMGDKIRDSTIRQELNRLNNTQELLEEIQKEHGQIKRFKNKFSNITRCVREAQEDRGLDDKGLDPEKAHFPNPEEAKKEE